VKINHARLQRLWYSKNDPLSLVLVPLAWLYAMLMRVRRSLYRCGILRSHKINAVVIVVGNIAVGGTGKTPLVIALAGYLAQFGWRPGIVCHGYGGLAQHWPQQVRADSDPRMVGDEAVLMARRAKCPVSACGRHRVKAARELIKHHGCNLIISDDGLQHLALQRDLEIVVVDGERRHGNGRCLPAGPLREPLSRLSTVDMLVMNVDTRHKVNAGEVSMQLVAGPAVNMLDNTRRSALCKMHSAQVHAVAGIGNPPRFFRMIERSGLSPIPHAFADHHDFVPADLQFDDELEVLMTEKDAVKCARFARQHHWYVPVTAQLSAAFFERMQRLLPSVPDDRARQDAAEVVA
jgi:tetraacyldisaccharide 4'-kinase